MADQKHDLLPRTICRANRLFLRVSVGRLQAEPAHVQSMRREITIDWLSPAGEPVPPKRLSPQCAAKRRQVGETTLYFVQDDGSAHDEFSIMLRFSAASRRPKIWIILLSASTAVLLATSTSRAQVGGRLISTQAARQQGLERAWFSRVELDTSRNHLVRWILDHDQLLFVTSAGVLQAMDAHTGRTLWVTAIGDPDFPSLGPAANQDYVALVNGSTLYVLDRESGRPLMERRLGGAPGAGPALTSQYAFVPLVTGRVEAYPIGDEKNAPWFYQSFGRTLVAPMATPRSVVWTSDAGNFYLARSNPPAVRYRLETASEFLAPPAYRDQMVYAISMLGELYAVDERTGSRRWKYATGYTTDRAPAVVGDRVYVTSEQPALHCVDAVKGYGLWETEGVAQFAAASDKYVYGIGPFGTIYVLDLATGVPVGRIDTGGTCRALVNQETDRLYLITDDGIVQCLHEVGRSEPLYHATPAATEKPAAAPEKPESSESRSTAEVPPQPPAPPERGGATGSDQPTLDFGTATPGADQGSQQPAAEKPEKPADENPFGVEENPFDF